MSCMDLARHHGESSPETGVTGKSVVQEILSSLILTILSIPAYQWHAGHSYPNDS